MMERRRIKFFARRPDPDAGGTRNSTTVLERVAEVMCLLRRITGAMLGVLAFGTPITNVLICLFIVFVGPSFIIELLPR